MDEHAEGILQFWQEFTQWNFRHETIPAAAIEDGLARMAALRAELTEPEQVAPLDEIRSRAEAFWLR